MKKKKSFLFDFILIVSLILISCVSLACLLIFRQDGKTVSVEINGEVVGEYSLDTDGEYPLNGGTNILIIENGEAYMRSADCPDRTCVRTGRVCYAGESIVCLPNRVAIVVKGEDASGVDLVS